MALANYLSNETSQLTEFQEMGVIPSNKVVQETAEVQEDAVAKAVMEMSQPTHSVVMPKVPEIVSFWPAMDAIINDAYKGNITESEYMEKLDKLVEDTSKVTEPKEEKE
jgi:arabinogalactan oligomer/maltooligosaccharide transport system substrate-binding protein